MARRAITRPRFPGRQRSATDWGRSVDVEELAVLSATKVLVGTFTLSNPGIAETIRRTRGVLTVSSDQSVAAEYVAGAMGMIVVTDTALAVGITAIPGPLTNANDDGWWVWEPCSFKGSLGGGGVVSQSYQFDSKAMRRVEEGFSGAIVFESGSNGNAMAVAVSLSILTSRT